MNGAYEIKPFPIGYNDILKNIGLPTSNYEDYIYLIENNEFSDYNNLFNYIEESIRELKTATKKCIYKSADSHIVSKSGENRGESRIYNLKKSLLEKISSNLPQLYAESISNYDDEYLSNRYFYRKCMEDLFNVDKFLVLGNKGTGKTYIYRSLANQHIVKELRRRAHKEDFVYEFIP